MKATIYYFTGTGNSLKAAKEIAEKIENCELIPMAALTKEDIIKPDAEKVGFVFPLYWYGLPGIVRDFIEKTELSKTSYIFSATTAMYADGLAIEQLEELLEKKNKSLNAGFYIKMPSNYILSMNPQSGKKQKDIIEKAERKIESITEIINGNIDKKDKETFFYRTVTNAKSSYNKWMKDFSNNDSKFWVKDDLCNSCETCEKICPVNDIEIKQESPVWKHNNCQQCLGCINSCPTKAIQYGNKTIKKGRYRNSQISIKELINQKIQ